MTGREIATNEAPRRPGDPPMLVAASDRIRSELGWEPRKPALEEMVADAWAFAQAHPNGYSELGPRARQRRGQHLAGRLLGVDPPDPLGLLGGELQVRGRDPLEEFVPLALEPVERLAARRASAARRCAGSSNQQQRAIRLQAAGGELVDRPHRFDARAPGRPLIGQRGVDEPIQQHPRAVGEERLDRLLHELRPSRGVQQRLGTSADRAARGP